MAINRNPESSSYSHLLEQIIQGSHSIVGAWELGSRTLGQNVAHCTSDLRRRREKSTLVQQSWDTLRLATCRSIVHTTSDFVLLGSWLI